MISAICRLAVVVAAVLLTGAARADWLEASSPHFLIYANAPERELREQALDLERFDLAMRKYQGVPDTPEARANKVTVFVLRNPTAIQQLCRCQNVYGMYRAAVSGPVAFTPRRAGDESFNALSARTVLFHEYAHHFLLGTYSLAFPAWFSEGYAEFMSTAKFKDDTVILGGAAQHRAASLLDSTTRMTAAQLFDPGRRRLSETETESLYARGWLLTHYLSVDRERYAKLRKYVGAINTGTPSLAAAQAIFGDLAALDRTLNAYVRQSLDGLKFTGITIPDSAVTVRPLGPGAAALMDLRIRSTYGVDDKTALPLYNEAQPIAARFPDDPTAQGWFTEMAFDAKHYDEATAAADRALAKDPASIQALLYKAQLLTVGDTVPASAWAEARKLIVRANRADMDDAQPLWLYYQSFIDANQAPTKAALAGLYRAVELVPQDIGLRMTAAMQRLRDDQPKEARALLQRIAYSPHAPADNAAARMIAAIDAGKPRDEILAAAAKADPPAAKAPVAGK